VKLLVCGVLLLSRAASAADACALVPAGQLSPYRGIAKQTPFKLPASMLAIKKNGVLRTNVNPPSPDLTRQVLLLALKAN